jgi:hypothetical protein
MIGGFFIMIVYEYDIVAYVDLDSELYKWIIMPDWYKDLTGDEGRLNLRDAKRYPPGDFIILDQELRMWCFCFD